MIAAQHLDWLNPQQMRAALQSLLAEVAAKDERIQRQAREATFKQALIDKLTHEVAVLRRLKYAATSEKFRTGMSAEQRSLLEEALEADLAELGREIEQFDLGAQAQAPQEKQQPRREALPPELPRHEVHHEPKSTVCTTPGCGCQMKRIGQDVSEKLDYQPGVFSVERHIRGKWACAKCAKLVQAPVPAHVIDKGLPTTGLLAQVLVAKYMDTCRCTGRSTSSVARA